MAGESVRPTLRHLATRTEVGTALACAALLASYGTIDPSDPRWSGSDLHRYEAMRAAVPGFATVRAPEAFRLAGPWLAACVGWRSVALVALAASLVLLWTWLRREGLSEAGASVGVIVVAATRYLVGAVAWDPFQAGDALGLAFLLGAMCAAQRRAWCSFAAAVAVGCVAKETALLAIPYALAASRERLGVAALASAPGLALWFALHRWIPHTGGSPFAALSIFATYKMSPVALIRDVDGFGPTVLVPVVAANVLRARVRFEHLILALAVFFSSLAGFDGERLMLPAAPLLALGVGRATEHWPPRARLALLGVAALGSLHHEISRWPLPSRRWTLVVTLSSLALATGLAVFQRAKSRSEPCGDRDPRTATRSPSDH